MLKNKINSLTQSETRRRLFSNFLSLSFLQVANYIFPLITLPYLVRVLGPEKFGLIAFAQAFIGYFQILTDYGFNLSATREISIHRENKEKVSEIFSSVIVIKFFLLLISLLIMSVIVFSFEKFRQDWQIYYLTFGMVLGNVLFPVWFFQGVENMKYITFLNVLAKLIFTVAIFLFVKQASDYLCVPLLNSIGFVVAGVLSLHIVFRDFGVKLYFPKLESLKHQLKEGWHIFISTVAISLYTISNTFILGLFTNNTIVGYYSAAERIIKVVQGLLGPISQTVYPHISKLAAESKERALNFIRKLVYVIGSGSLFLSLLIFIFATQIVSIVLGSQYQQSIIVLKILSFLPFIIGLSNVFAVQGLYAFEFQWVVPRFIIPIASFHLFLLSILTYFLSLIGTASAVIITEILVTIFSVKNFSKLILEVGSI